MVVLVLVLSRVLKRNHYCALVQAGNDPEKYRATMLTLGKYHSRDIYSWEGGGGGFVYVSSVSKV